MNTSWLTKYAVVINGEFDGLVGYLAPLNGEQISREISRISAENEISYKDVNMVRRYK